MRQSYVSSKLPNKGVSFLVFPLDPPGLRSPWHYRKLSRASARVEQDLPKWLDKAAHGFWLEVFVLCRSDEPTICCGKLAGGGLRRAGADGSDGSDGDSASARTSVFSSFFSFFLGGSVGTSQKVSTATPRKNKPTPHPQYPSCLCLFLSPQCDWGVVLVGVGRNKTHFGPN